MAETEKNILAFLFELLQVSVGRRSALTSTPSAEEWTQLFDFCFSQGLVGMGFKAILRLPKEQHPDMIQMLQWTGQAELIRQKNETANRLCAKVVRILGKHRLNPIILKGQTLAALYNEPMYRKTGDIDVWCDVLSPSLSWRRNKIREILRPYITPKQARHVFYHHMEFTSIEGTSVEVHFTPTWMFNPLHNSRFQRFATEKRREWSEAGIPTTPNGLTCADAEFNMVFVLMHMYRHLFAEGANLRQLMDYYFVLNSLREYENENENQNLRYENQNQNENNKPHLLLKQMGLYDFAGAVGYALKQIYDIPEEWLVVPVDPKRGKVLVDELLSHHFDHDLDRKPIQRFVHYQKRRLKYYLLYPSEALWSLPFIVIQWLWRKLNGFL